MCKFDVKNLAALLCSTRLEHRGNPHLRLINLVFRSYCRTLGADALNNTLHVQGSKHMIEYYIYNVLPKTLDIPSSCIVCVNFPHSIVALASFDSLKRVKLP